MDDLYADAERAEIYKPLEAGQKKRRYTVARSVHVVVNNYGAGDRASLKTAMEAVCDYGIIGAEVGAATKTPHLQCYFHLAKQTSIKKIQDTIYAAITPPACWISRAKGTAVQNKVYCSKSGDFVEFGVLPKQGERTDWSEVYSLITGGADAEAIFDFDPGKYIKHSKGIEKAIALKRRKRAVTKFRDVKVTLITGPTGTGKTRWIYDTMPPEDWHKICKVTGSDLKSSFWLDYDGQDILLIDEYSNDVNITKLLNILDGHPYTLNIKGSHTYAEWTHVVITTNLRSLHSHANEEHIAALQRRITETIDKWPSTAVGSKRRRDEATSSDSYAPRRYRDSRQGRYRGYGKSKPW